LSTKGAMGTKKSLDQKRVTVSKQKDRIDLIFEMESGVLEFSKGQIQAALDIPCLHCVTVLC